MYIVGNFGKANYKMKKFLFISLIFLIFNLLLSFLFFLKDTFVDENQIFRKYGKENVLKAYSDLNENQIINLLNETWGRELAYDPDCYFKEAEVKGEFLNVNSEGIRFNGNKNKLNKNKIFLFGGSTTFGYGVSDNETIAAQLENELNNTQVINYGAGFYYSTLEKLKFKSLLQKGEIPDKVIFLDGLNEFYSTDAEIENFYSPWFDLAIKVPFIRLIHAIYKLSVADLIIEREENFLRNCSLRYLSNKKEIVKECEKYNIEYYFIIQPIPFYNYDLENHIFVDSTSFNKELFDGYILLKNNLDDEIIWIADIQENDTINNYVDQVHYTKSMCGRLAKKLKEIIEP